MKPNTMTGDVPGDLRRGCFFGNLSDDARALLARAVEIADEAATSMIQSHGHIADNGWLCVEDEPVDEDVAYLVGRGLLERDEEAPMFVRFKPPSHGGSEHMEGKS